MDLELSKTFVPFDLLKGKGTYRNAGILQAFLLKNDALLLDGNQQKYRRMHQKCLATLQSRKRKITTKGNPGNYFCPLTFCISLYEIYLHGAYDPDHFAYTYHALLCPGDKSRFWPPRSPQIPEIVTDHCWLTSLGQSISGCHDI